MKHAWTSLVVLGLLVASAGRSDAQAPQPSIEYEITIEGLGTKPVTMDVDSWSWGASSYDDASMMGMKKDVQVQEVNLVLQQSPTTAMMLEALLAKKQLRRVVLRIKQPAAAVFEFALSNVKVTTFQTGGSGGSYGRGGTMEQMSLSFKTAKMTVKNGANSHSTDIINNN
jgi:type VI protein secretion system component Hcp